MRRPTVRYICISVFRTVRLPVHAAEKCIHHREGNKKAMRRLARLLCILVSYSFVFRKKRSSSVYFICSIGQLSNRRRHHSVTYIITLVASRSKRSVTVWRPSVRPFVPYFSNLKVNNA